jgi:hypothetical protein
MSGTVFINVIEAKGLQLPKMKHGSVASRVSNRLLRPYCLLAVDHHSYQSSSVREGEDIFRYEQLFSFAVPSLESEVSISIHNFESGNPLIDAYFGSLKLPLKEFSHGVPIDQWYSIDQEDDMLMEISNSTTTSHTGSGLIHLQIQYAFVREEEERTLSVEERPYSQLLLKTVLSELYSESRSVALFTSNVRTLLDWGSPAATVLFFTLSLILIHFQLVLSGMCAYFVGYMVYTLLNTNTREHLLEEAEVKRNADDQASLRGVYRRSMSSFMSWASDKFDVTQSAPFSLMQIGVPIDRPHHGHDLPMLHRSRSGAPLEPQQATAELSAAVVTESAMVAIRFCQGFRSFSSELSLKYYNYAALFAALAAYIYLFTPRSLLMIGLCNAFLVSPIYRKYPKFAASFRWSLFPCWLIFVEDVILLRCVSLYRKLLGSARHAMPTAPAGLTEQALLNRNLMQLNEIEAVMLASEEEIDSSEEDMSDLQSDVNSEESSTSALDNSHSNSNSSIGNSPKRGRGAKIRQGSFTGSLYYPHDDMTVVSFQSYARPDWKNSPMAQNDSTLGDNDKSHKPHLHHCNHCKSSLRFRSKWGCPRCKNNFCKKCTNSQTTVTPYSVQGVRLPAKEHVCCDCDQLAEARYKELTTPHTVSFPKYMTPYLPVNGDAGISHGAGKASRTSSQMESDGSLSLKKEEEKEKEKEKEDGDGNAEVFAGEVLMPYDDLNHEQELFSDMAETAIPSREWGFAMDATE